MGKMNLYVNVSLEDAREVGSCNACISVGKVFLIRIRSLSFRLCKDCIDRLNSEIKIIEKE